MNQWQSSYLKNISQTQQQNIGTCVCVRNTSAFFFFFTRQEKTTSRESPEWFGSCWPLPVDNDGQVSETPKTAAMEPGFCEWSAIMSRQWQTMSSGTGGQCQSVSQSANPPLIMLLPLSLHSPTCLSVFICFYACVSCRSFIFFRPFHTLEQWSIVPSQCLLKCPGSTIFPTLHFRLLFWLVLR